MPVAMVRLGYMQPFLDRMAAQSRFPPYAIYAVALATVFATSASMSATISSGLVDGA